MNMPVRERRIQAPVPEWLSLAMQGTFNEIYIIDSKTLRLVDVNPAACDNLRFNADELSGMTLSDILHPSSVHALGPILTQLRTGGTVEAELLSTHVRKDGTTYPIELRVFHCPLGPASVFIAIGNNVNAGNESTQILRASEMRFRAIVSNTPGLVYQFLLHDDGHVSFPYLSDGCHALLGVAVNCLRADPDQFEALILPDDRPSYRNSMAASAAGLQTWNWEGRVRIEAWHDIKWINLRSTPRAIPGTGVLWEGIMTNITQSKLAQAELKQSHVQLAELSAHIETVKEKERTRIAREIHDDLGGNLAAIKMALAMLKRRLPAEQAELVERFDYVDALVDRSIEAAHRLSADLRPGILDLGIVAAVEWQAQEFEKQLGVPCATSSNKPEIVLPAEHATAVFRIFQEALTNIGKHANATRVSVTLTETMNNVVLQVIDNGRGIAATDRLKPTSFGIRGMMERASALGGELSVGPVVDGGSMVALCIPLHAMQS